MPQYMVIETFLDGSVEEIYERYHRNGRMLPDGLHYVDSWLTKDENCCFQLMETERFELFEEWTEKWSDLTHFKIVEIGIKPEKGSNK